MADKIENGILYECGPFYEHDYYAPKQDTYVCSVTGQVCESISKHFREYRAFIRMLSETGDTRIFLQGEPNLCPSMRCIVYENEFLKRAKTLKTQGR